MPKARAATTGAVLQLLVALSLLQTAFASWACSAHEGSGSGGTGGQGTPPASITFGALNFTLESLPIPAQVDLLLANGYEHVSFWPQYGSPVANFWADERVASGVLSIAGVLYLIDLDQGHDSSATIQLLDELSGKGAPLWLLLAGLADQDELVTTVHEVSSLAEPRGVPVVLYPHQGLAIADAESANRLKLAAGRPNVSISLHLCHELKAGNRDRLAEVIDNVIDNVSLVTIHGADQNGGLEGGEWSRTIMPLDRGDFDVQERYLRPLLAAGYQGPIVLHTYGIADPPEQHYARSARRWRSMQADLAPH